MKPLPLGVDRNTWEALANGELRIQLDVLGETTLTETRPRTRMQALMEAAPHTTPERSIEEVQDLRHSVADSVEALTEQDQFIIEAIHMERITYEQLGKRLGVSKPHAWRLARAAEARLRASMLTNPAILEYLEGDLHFQEEE